MPRSSYDAFGRPIVHDAAGPLLGDETQVALGRRLRDLYRPEMIEPIPFDILTLLGRLGAAMSAPPTGADRGTAAPAISFPSP